MSSPRIALIHATALAVEPIRPPSSATGRRRGRMNLLDDSLSVDRAESGRLTGAMVQRFVDLAPMRSAPAARHPVHLLRLRPRHRGGGRATGLPTLKPNEAMFEQALASAREAAR
jgi:hypothetical protein